MHVIVRINVLDKLSASTLAWLSLRLVPPDFLPLPSLAHD